VNLSYPAARLRLMQMLRTSVNQAEIMCKAAKNTFYEPIGAAIKTAAMAQTTDYAIIQAATKPGYEAGCIPVTMHWKKLFGRGKKGVMLVAGGVAAAIAFKTNPALHIIIAVMTVIAAIWFIYVRSENERSLVRAKAEVLPELDRALAEGRYVLPAGAPRY
jgi:predicted anti-sigma-YlaC factor YlaD